jgi:hypothetical protein
MKNRKRRLANKKPQKVSFSEETFDQKSISSHDSSDRMQDRRDFQYSNPLSSEMAALSAEISKKFYLNKNTEDEFETASNNRELSQEPFTHKN